MPPEIIKELVERFERNLPAYKSQGYKEDQLRQEFLNPFFEALGWDVRNTSGAAPAYRDVIYEDSIKMAKGTKAPDYCFTLSGRRMFFVEAKKPSVFIKMDTHPAYQLRRYAWSAKLPLSILTDFEEFAVYESRKKPKKDDKASTERIMYLTYEDYIDKWDEIYNIFSKEAILKGSFDRFIETAKKKRGTAEVDDEFLKEIEGWRDELARNIALRNSMITVRELNYSVQRTIDRIIFLRMCEDRGIESYGQLNGLLEKRNIYLGLCEIFNKADEKYNSGLFHFKKERGRTTLPDNITLNLTIDDKVLVNIIKHLYYPDSPYEFSVLSPEILGNVYEQFLGKVIRLTPGHRAKIEAKPEVKKAGGVYYTPQYVVDYIVEFTVKSLCKGNTPNQISKYRILDPACGSGSFLLGAYSELLEYHLEYYTNRKNPKSFKDKVYQGKHGEWFLTIKEKKRILLNNIYGVDIDEQAVEVTKLSLLLKVLEGENKDVIEKQQKLWRERALPDLSNNIKCGNSLIEPSYYNSGFQINLFNEATENFLNPFDWEMEFSEIMKNGGFDVVLGNPPYRMLQPHNTTEEILSYLKSNFFAADFKIDFFHLFLQRGVNLLNDNKGILGFILPVTLLNNVYVKSLRNWIQDKCKINQIAVANSKVFSADVHTCILILQRESSSTKRKNNKTMTTIDFNESFVNQTNRAYSSIKQSQFGLIEGSVWNVLINDQNAQILTKVMSGNRSLGDMVKINRGLITGNRDKYFSTEKKSDIHIPIIAGADVFRYYSNPPSEYVLFDRPKSAGGCWDSNVHNAPHKVVIRQIGKKPTASFIKKPLAVTGNIFTIMCDDENKELFVLGIINSKLIEYFWRIMFTDFKTSFPQVTIFSLSQIPIFQIDNSDNRSKEISETIVSHVLMMLELEKQLRIVNTQEDREKIERISTSTSMQIDQLVYELYGLTQEEIEIVEGSLTHPNIHE